MQIVTEKLQIIPRFNSKSRLKMKNKEKENNRRVKMNQTSRKKFDSQSTWYSHLCQY